MITTKKHDADRENSLLGSRSATIYEETWLKEIAMSYDWWGRDDQERGSDHDWWSQQGQEGGPGPGKGPAWQEGGPGQRRWETNAVWDETEWAARQRTARIEPYEEKRGKSWGKSKDAEAQKGKSKDAEVQRPSSKKGKGGKPSEKKGEELPELTWSDGRDTGWGKGQPIEQRTPDPNRVTVLLEEIDDTKKKGKVLLVSWESKRWTLPSKSVDHRNNELGTLEKPNLYAWELLAREAVEEWVGITFETELEIKHHGVYGATRYMVMAGRIEVAVAVSFLDRKKTDAHRAALFDLDDETAFPIFQNTKDIMLKVKDELSDGVAGVPSPDEGGKLPMKPPEGLMSWDEFLGSLKGRLGYTNLQDVMKKKMSYRSWEHVLVKLTSKVSSLAVVEAAQHEGDPAVFNPSVHVMVQLRP